MHKGPDQLVQLVQDPVDHLRARSRSQVQTGGPELTIRVRGVIRDVATILLMHDFTTCQLEPAASEGAHYQPMRGL